METMYKINQHESGGKLTHYTVTPIRVVRRGIAEGCSAESITAISHDGRVFHGDPAEYSRTEVEAWDSIRSNLLDGIRRAKDEHARRGEEIAQWELVLSQLPNDQRDHRGLSA